MPDTENIELNELVKSIKSEGCLKSKAVESALKAVPRHLFVPKHMREMAYRDCPLAIGHDQTISQPSTVIAMTEALQPKKGQKILEIGAGSGWQAGLLGEMVGPKGHVWSVDVIKELVQIAKLNLKSAKIKNVEVFHNDGSMGLLKHAPFDRIIVTAACPSIPPNLIEQLKPNGRMVIPLGNIYMQMMTVVTKMANGKIEKEEIGKFMFVPLVGRYGFKQA